MATNFDEIIPAIAQSKFSTQEFDKINITQWPQIFKKIESIFIQKFNSNTKFNWWWENLKKGYLSVQFPDNNGFVFLPHFIDRNEKVFFLACDTDKNPSKQWIYEGYPEPILHVLNNTSRFEYYLVSKKYEWLIGENHHQYLIASGTIRETVHNFARNRNLPHALH